MPDDVAIEETETPQETEAPAEPGVVVEVERPKGGPQLKDEELEKLTSVNDDEIRDANESAKKAVRSLRSAYQEQRRRAEQWSRDASTASNLAEQLYRENQALRQNVARSETALINQALNRAKSQLEHAQSRHRAALDNDDKDQIVAANLDVARMAAEVDRLSLLQPAAVQAEEVTQESPDRPAGQAPMSERTRNWVAKHTWFGKDQEMTQFAMRQHHHLVLDGITEESNPDLYWRTIENKLKEQYPEKFDAGQRTESRPARPAAVAGGTRSNGAIHSSANGKKVVHLTESQVRIAGRLGLTPEQYAMQLVKEQQEEERERGRRS